MKMVENQLVRTVDIISIWKKKKKRNQLLLLWFQLIFKWFTVAEHLIAQHSAIKMLHSRVKLILAYIKAIENGTLPANSEILREAYALSQRLPVIQSSAFKEEYYTVKEN